jgi:hypothetical protein
MTTLEAPARTARRDGRAAPVWFWRERRCKSMCYGECVCGRWFVYVVGYMEFRMYVLSRIGLVLYSTSYGVIRRAGLLI